MSFHISMQFQIQKEHFNAAADNCGYAVATEIQKSYKVLLVSKATLNCGHLTGHLMLQSNLTLDGDYLLL